MLLWQEWWQLRKGCVGAREEDVEFEEELYSAGTVVVWSQGSRSHASNVYKAFTVDSPVQQVGYEMLFPERNTIPSWHRHPLNLFIIGLQALWCNFAAPQNNKYGIRI